MDAGSPAPRAVSPPVEPIAGRYAPLALLGSGSYADVYRVRDASSGRELALKLMRRVPEPGEDLAFRREFLLLNRLRHPGLVQVFEFDQLPDGRPFFSSEIIEGKSLRDVAPLAGDAASAAMRDLARVLDHLHRSGLVHCDLKPDNAILTPDGSVKLLDLGLAQAPGEGHSGGTPAFMAPEVARGAPADPRSDLYSLGALGYFLLAGRPPHLGATAAEVLATALRNPPPPLPDTADPRLAAVVMALLAKDPAARPPLGAVLAALGAPDAADRRALPSRVLEIPLVGRHAELARLESMLGEALEGGRLAIVRLAGPMGIGKDRLLAEFRALRQAEGLRFVTGRCVPGGANYHPFDEAIRAMGGQAPPPWSEGGEMASSRAALLGAVAAYFARIGRAGPIAMQLADWHAADPASQAVLAHLERIRPEGQVVLFVSERESREGAIAVGPLSEEDVETAAEAMLGGVALDAEFCRELHEVSEGNPLFLHGILARALDLGLLEHVGDGRWRSRKPLAATALPTSLAEAMLGRLAGRSVAAVQIVRTLAVFGHPVELDLLSLAAGLSDEAFAAALDELEAAGLLRYHDDGPFPGKPSPARASLTQGALGEAVAAALAAEDRLAIQRRIVLALEASTEPGRREQDPVVVEDLARHSLPWDPGDRGLRYGLAAARAHLKVYAVDRARHFLEAGLEYLGDQGADGPWVSLPTDVTGPEYPESQAADGKSAGQSDGLPGMDDRASPATAGEASGRARIAAASLETAYHELLADAYRHAGAFQAARERYEALLGRLPAEDPRLPRVQASLGLACQSLSLYDEARAAFDAASAAAERLDDPYQSLRALTSRARLAYLGGDVDRAADIAEKALEAARRIDSPALLAESLALIGYLMVVKDPAATERGLAMLEEALTLRRNLGDPVALGDGLMFFGNALIIAGRPLEALGTFSQNLQICRDTGAAAEDAITAMLNVALSRLELGAFREAASGAREAREAAEEVGSRDLGVYAEVIEAVAIAQMGELRESAMRLEGAVAHSRELGSSYLEAAALTIGAEARLVAGASLEARDDLERARRLAGEAGTREFEARALAGLAEACARLGAFDAAQGACDELEALARKLGPSSPLARWHLVRGDLARRLGELQAAEDWLGEALALSEQLGMIHLAGLAALCRGQVRARAGKFDLARDDLLFAQRTAARSGCPHLLIDSLLALSGTTFDPAEASRYREMAEGHLGPLLSGLPLAWRARYLEAGILDRAWALRGGDRGGARVPAEIEALVPFLDRPLRDLLGRLQDSGAGTLPVGDLVARLLEARPDPDQVLARTLELARERFGAERCLAVLKGDSGFEVRAMIPQSDDLLRFSRSFLEMAVAQNRTLWTVDAMADPRLAAHESVAQLEMRAIACTPVRAGGKAIGALYLDWSDPSGGLTEAGKRDFETLAGIAGVCLAQAEMMAGLEQRTERLEMMNELSDALARTLSVDELLEMALRHSLRISGAQVGCVLVGAELEPRLARDRDGTALARMHISTAVCERLRREREAFALIDAEAANLSASVAAEGLRSVMAVPVRVDGELRGAFYLASEVSVRGFTTRDLALLQAVANQVAVALGRVDLVNELARRERMQRELEIARDVQVGLLPKRLPGGPGYALAAASLPALEVGGDFYDVLELPGGRIGLLIGDVAGKGVPAALLMASLLSGFRAIAPGLDEPGAVLGRLNDLLITQRASPGVFVTALYAIYDPDTRELSWSCAGHPPPLAWPDPLPCEGPVLGLLPGMAFESEAALLALGAVVAFYTDGLEDARGPGNPSLGRDELERRFAGLAPKGAAQVVEGLLRLIASPVSLDSRAPVSVLLPSREPAFGPSPLASSSAVPMATEDLVSRENLQGHVYDDVTILVISVDKEGHGAAGQG